MQPFLITCETCHARLKVTQAAAMGQILACPKCQSMVQIPALTEGMAADASKRVAGMGQGRAGDPGHTEPGNPEGIPGAVADGLPGNMAAGLAGMPMVPASEPITPPPPVWETDIPAEVFGRRLAWRLVAGIALGILAAGLVGAWWVRDARMPPVQNQPAETTKDPSSDPTRDQVETVAAGTGDEDQVSGIPSKEESVLQPAPGSEMHPAESPSHDQEAEDIRQVLENPRQEIASNQPKIEPGSEGTADSPTKQDPRDQKPMALAPELDPRGKQGVLSDASSEPRRMEDHPTDDREPNTATMSNIRLLPPDPNANRPNTEVVWTMPIARYQIRRLPLAQFLDEIALLAGVPVDLDPGSLASVGATTQTPISVDINNTTLLDILEQALRPIGLKPVVFPTYLVVARSSEDKEEVEPFVPSKPKALLQSVLDQPVTFTFSEWTPLVKIHRQWQRIFGLTILIDWEALAKAGLQPSSQIRCSVVQRPLGEALTATLGELGLTWIAIDDRTIQITTGP